jgi:hypothetical protein
MSENETTNLEPFELKAIAMERLGNSTKAFLKTELGEYLFEKATVDLMEASGSMLDINPHDTKAMAKAQVKANTARNFKVWLSEAIEEGEAAGIELDNLINNEEQ